MEQNKMHRRAKQPPTFLVFVPTRTRKLKRNCTDVVLPDVVLPFAADVVLPDVVLPDVVLPFDVAMAGVFRTTILRCTPSA